MLKEFSRVLPNKDNKVTVKVPFCTVDAGIVAGNIDLQDLRNYNRRSEELDNGILSFDKESGLWTMRRDIVLDSISNEEGVVTVNGTLKTDDLEINDSPIDEYIKEIAGYEFDKEHFDLEEGEGIKIEDNEDYERTKIISLAPISDYFGGVVGSSTEIPVIEYDDYGRIINTSSAQISDSLKVSDGNISGDLKLLDDELKIIGSDTITVSLDENGFNISTSEIVADKDFVDSKTEEVKEFVNESIGTTIQSHSKLLDDLCAFESDGFVVKEGDSLITKSGTTVSDFGIEDVYTKSEIDIVLNDKADKASTLEGYGITNAYNKDFIDSEISELKSKIDLKSDKSTTLEGYGIEDAYNKEFINDLNVSIHAELVRKADSSESLSGYGITDAYTKTEVDSLKSSLDSLIETKASKSESLSGYGITDAYTKSESDLLLKSKSDTSYVDAKLDTKVDKSNVYSKSETYSSTELDRRFTEVSESFDRKADKSTTLEGYGITDSYTKTEVDSKESGIRTDLSLKADKATTLEGYGILNAYTKSEMDELIEVIEDEEF